jgi:hypothetical protein
MAPKGRKPIAEELRLRERIEGLYFGGGLRPIEIRDALASAQNTTPVELSLRQVQAHVQHIREDWAKSIDPARRDAELAELVANLKDAIRTAASASARYRDSAVGVGYANNRLRAINSLARLEGLGAGSATAGNANTAPTAHPFDALMPAEQAASMRHLADIIEETE